MGDLWFFCGLDVDGVTLWKFDLWHFLNCKWKHFSILFVAEWWTVVLIYSLPIVLKVCWNGKKLIWSFLLVDIKWQLNLIIFCFSPSSKLFYAFNIFIDKRELTKCRYALSNFAMSVVNMLIGYVTLFVFLTISTVNIVFY